VNNNHPRTLLFATPAVLLALATVWNGRVFLRHRKACHFSSAAPRRFGLAPPVSTQFQFHPRLFARGNGSTP